MKEGIFVCLILGIITSNEDTGLGVFWLETCGVLSGIWLVVFSTYFEKSDKTKKTYTWECEKCGKEFKSEKEAVMHEKKCRKKK